MKYTVASTNVGLKSLAKCAQRAISYCFSIYGSEI